MNKKITPIFIIALAIMALLFTIPLTASAATTSTAKTKYVTGCTMANIRKSASTSSKSLQKIYYTESVKTLRQTGSWTVVETKNSGTGYVLTKYLSASKPAKNTSLKASKMVIKNTAPIYTYPTTTKTKVTTLAFGDQVTTYETKGNFIRVTCGTKEGFVLKANVGTYTSTKKYINLSSASVRTAAKASASVYKKAYYRESYNCYGTVSSYTRVKINSKYYFIATKYLSISISTPKSSKIQTTKALSARKNPSTSAASLGVIKAYETVTAYEKVGSFTRIAYNGEYAYILTSGTVSVQEKYASVTANVKNAPKAEGTVIGKIYYRQKYTCYEQTGSYTRISYNGKNGYVMTSNLIASLPTYSAKTVYISASTAKIYDLASGDGKVVATLPYGTKFTAYEEYGSFTRISYNNKEAYISTPNIVLKLNETVSGQKQISNEFAYLRVLPVNDAAVKYTVNYFERLDCVEVIGSSWMKVKYKNEFLYISLTSLEDVRPRPTVQASNPLAQAMYERGMQLLGTPYLAGSSINNISTFDCLSFVRYLHYSCAGISLPTTLPEQRSTSQGVNIDISRVVKGDFSNLEVGDCIYFNTTDEGLDGHVAMYIGNGEIMHATRRTGYVCIAPLDQARQQSIVLVKRYL